eukprot:1902215-Pyramimonas_sp.AAC.1
MENPSEYIVDFPDATNRKDSVRVVGRPVFIEDVDLYASRVVDHTTTRTAPRCRSTPPTFTVFDLSRSSGPSGPCKSTLVMDT